MNGFSFLSYPNWTEFPPYPRIGTFYSYLPPHQSGKRLQALITWTSTVSVNPCKWFTSWEVVRMQRTIFTSTYLPRFFFLKRSATVDDALPISVWMVTENHIEHLGAQDFLQRFMLFVNIASDHKADSHFTASVRLTLKAYPSTRIFFDFVLDSWKTSTLNIHYFDGI